MISIKSVQRKICPLPRLFQTKICTGVEAKQCQKYQTGIINLIGILCIEIVQVFQGIWSWEYDSQSKTDKN